MIPLTSGGARRAAVAILPAGAASETHLLLAARGIVQSFGQCGEAAEAESQPRVGGRGGRHRSPLSSNHGVRARRTRLTPNGPAKLRARGCYSGEIGNTNHFVWQIVTGVLSRITRYRRLRFWADFQTSTSRPVPLSLVATRVASAAIAVAELFGYTRAPCLRSGPKMRGDHLGGAVDEMLPTAELRAIARARDPEPSAKPVPQRYCLGCLAPLAHGRPVFRDACDNLWWDVVPTVSGELWTGRR
jgi:hypothetical protein